MTAQGAPQTDAAPVRAKSKRPSKGMRRHNRRLKQEARRAGLPGTEVKKRKPAA
jgi:hypothetical protein